MFVHNLIQRFLTVLDTITEGNIPSDATLDYCNRFLELMVDIEVRNQIIFTLFFVFSQ